MILRIVIVWFVGQKYNQELPYVMLRPCLLLMFYLNIKIWRVLVGFSFLFFSLFFPCASLKRQVILSVITILLLVLVWQSVWIFWTITFVLFHSTQFSCITGAHAWFWYISASACNLLFVSAMSFDECQNKCI